MHTIMPSFCVLITHFFLKSSFNDLSTKDPICFPNTWKKLWCELDFYYFAYISGLLLLLPWLFFCRYFQLHHLATLKCSVQCLQSHSQKRIFFIQMFIEISHFVTDFILIAYFFSLMSYTYVYWDKIFFLKYRSILTLFHLLLSIWLEIVAVPPPYFCFCFQQV